MFFVRIQFSNKEILFAISHLASSWNSLKTNVFCFQVFKRERNKLKEKDNSFYFFFISRKGKEKKRKRKMIFLFRNWSWLFFFVFWINKKITFHKFNFVLFQNLKQTKSKITPTFFWNFIVWSYKNSKQKVSQKCPRYFSMKRDPNRTEIDLLNSIQICFYSLFLI